MATNTATYTGESGTIRFTSDSSAVATVASVRGFEISQTADAVESTVMGASGRTYLAGLTSFSGTMDLLFRDDASGQSALFSAIGTDPSSVSSEFYPSGETTGVKLSGAIMITDHTITANYDSMIECSVSFQGSGALTKTNL